MASAELAFILAGVGYALALLALAIATALASSGLATARLNLWSNLFFLWPAARAILYSQDLAGVAVVSYPAAWAEAGVFAVAFAASTFHHGCLLDAGLRQSLAPDTYLVLLVGTVVLGLAAAYTAFDWAGSSRHVSDAASTWLWSTVGCGTAGLGLLFTLAFIRVGQGRLDGCAWPHDSGDGDEYQAILVPGLHDVWDAVDYVTAWSSLVVAVLFLLQLAGTLKLAVLWFFAVLLLAMELMRTLLPHGAGLAQGTLIAVMAAAGAAFAVCQVLVCCTYSGRARAWLLAQYDWTDFGVVVLVGAAAVFLFLAENTPAVHPLWHALGALALYSAIESLYRKQSAFLFARRIKDSDSPACV